MSKLQLNSFENNACGFLKEVVKGNKMLQRVQKAAEGIKGNICVQEEMSKLSERYYVLCKKADQRVKNLQHLMIEWQRLVRPCLLSRLPILISTCNSSA